MIVQTRSKPAEVVRLKFSDGLSLEETPLDVALQISKLVVNRFAERSMLIWSLSSSFMFRAPRVRSKLLHSKFIIADIKKWPHCSLFNSEHAFLVQNLFLLIKKTAILKVSLMYFETVVYIWPYLFHSKFFFANILSYHASVKQAVFSIKFVSNTFNSTCQFWKTITWSNFSWSKLCFITWSKLC